MVGNEEERRQRAGLFVLFVTLNLNQKSHLDTNNINRCENMTAYRDY